MLELIGLNVWAVVVVWVMYMFIGAFWYSKLGFAKQWTKETGVDILKIPTAQANKILASVALSSFIQAFALGIILHSLNVNSLAEGLLVGLVVWFAFTTATTVGVTLYQKRSWKFLWLNSAYFLVVMGIGSAIFTLWQ